MRDRLFDEDSVELTTNRVTSRQSHYTELNTGEAVGKERPWKFIVGNG